MKNKALFVLSLLSVNLFTSTSTFAQTNSASHQHAHKHGLVKVHFTQQGDKLLLDLIAPSFDLMGFETMPKTKEQKIAFNRAMTILKNPKTFLGVNEEGQCIISSRRVEYSRDLHKTGDKLNPHSFVRARIGYSCAKPNNIKDVKYHWFTSFPNTQKIVNTSVSSQGLKKTGDVTATSRRFYFK